MEFVIERAGRKLIKDMVQVSCPVSPFRRFRPIVKADEFILHPMASLRPFWENPGESDRIGIIDAGGSRQSGPGAN